MLKIGEGRMLKNDLAAGLRDATGRYLVVFPNNGGSYRLTCQPHQSITEFVPTDLKSTVNHGTVEPGNYWIERIPDTD